MKYTAQQFEKAGSAGSVEELLAMAKAENVELTAAEAERFFRKNGELSDDELDDVAGGGCGGGSSEPEVPADFGFPDGQRVYTHNGFCKYCSSNGHSTPSKNFVLNWVDYPGGSYSLRCEVCGGVNRIDGFHVGDPSHKGIVRV